MFVHEGRLPHVLEPRAYFDPEQHRLERQRVFLPTPHLVGAACEWKHVGDQRALDIAGVPVVVRRGEGGLRAFVNVCVHRHAQVVPDGDSRAHRMVCPYHGFVYRDDGSLARVPEPEAFGPSPEARMAGCDGRLGRLKALPLVTRGGLVFVSLVEDAELLDSSLSELAQRAFSPSHRLVATYSLDLDCNWKVALENVLENYHVASLHRNLLARHPEVFRLFTGTLVGEAMHELNARSTRYRDSMGAESRWMLRCAEALRPGAHPGYEHLHAFPHVVVAATHLVSFAQTFVPTSPTTSRMRAWLAISEGDDASAFGRALRPLVRQGAKRFMRRVLAEDASIYRAVQRGLGASPHRGVLSAREERIFAFQTWLSGEVGRDLASTRRTEVDDAERGDDDRAS